MNQAKPSRELQEANDKLRRVVFALRSLLLCRDEGFTRSVARKLGLDYEDEYLIHGSSALAKKVYVAARETLESVGDEDVAESQHRVRRGPDVET
jgi:hypothetical protein